MLVCVGRCTSHPIRWSCTRCSSHLISESGASVRNRNKSESCELKATWIKTQNANDAKQKFSLCVCLRSSYRLKALHSLKECIPHTAINNNMIDHPHERCYCPHYALNAFSLPIFSFFFVKVTKSHCDILHFCQYEMIFQEGGEAGLWAGTGLHNCFL